ncbi:hypothetical protein [Nostoc sp. CALU 546]
MTFSRATRREILTQLRLLWKLFTKENDLTFHGIWKTSVLKGYGVHTSLK